MWPAPVTENDILWLDAEAEPQDAPPGPASGLAVSQLLASGVSIEWHDAVALVSRLADEVVSDKRRPRAGALPPVDAIWLEPDGRVHATLDRLRPEPLVAGFGRVLQALLHDRPAPANLRLLGWRAISQAGAALTLDDLIVELARWERPGRVAKLVDLFERARAAPRVLAVLSPSPVDISVPALDTRSDEAPRPDSRPLRVVRRLSERQIAVAVVGVLTCLVAAGTTAWWLARWGDGSPTGQGTISAPVARSSTSSISSPAGEIELPASGVVHGSPRSPIEAARTAPRSRSGQSAVDPGSEQRPAERSRPLAQPETTRPAGKDTPAVVTPAPMPARMPPTSPDADAHGTADARIYRSGDEAVTEPVLVKPRLPLQPRPEIPESALGVLELVVDESGRVESVHLKSPANRYREKWWLFAAKDWQFEPARKQGRPVKFLKRIALTDLNIAEPQ